MALLPFLQSLFGWIYFFAWSATFWPQVLLIHKRRTTAGLSTDFMAINVVGFIAYTVFTFCSYFLPSVADSYKAATGYAPQVEFNDVLFASHGAVMCAVLILQLFLLPPRTPPNQCVTIVSALALVSVVMGLLAALLRRLDWYVYLRYAGQIKVVSSVIKHFPQLFLNRKRGSTVGWSFTMILLDVVGGSFSVAQQVIRAIAQRNLAPFTSNLAKTFLAAESLAFDFFFIMQHVCFYTDRRDIDMDDKLDDAETERHTLV